MSFFGQKPERRFADLSAFIPLPSSSGGTYSSAGVLVNDDAARHLAVVWRCRTLLGGTISTLPVDVYRGGGANRTEVTPTPKLLVDPSVDVPLEAWLYQIIDSWLAAGNSYGMVASTDGGGPADGRFPTQIEMLDPACVQWKLVDQKWETFYNNQPIKRWPLGPLWHVPAYTVAGSPVGLNPVQYAKQLIGLGLAAEQFGAQFFGDGGHPTAVMSMDADPGEAGALRLKEKIKAALRGNREPVVISGGKLQPWQVNPQDSQFIETEQFTALQLCWFHGVPPAMLELGMPGSSITYQNREQKWEDFLALGLGYWIFRLENALSRLLPRPQTVKFNVGGLLRADIKTRFEVHGIAIDKGIETVDEVRALEDLPPLPQGHQGSPTELADIIAKSWRGANVIVTPDELRALLNRAGAGLEVPGPEMGAPAAPNPATDPHGGTPMEDPSSMPVGGQP